MILKNVLMNIFHILKKFFFLLFMQFNDTNILFFSLYILTRYVTYVTYCPSKDKSKSRIVKRLVSADCLSDCEAPANFL